MQGKNKDKNEDENEDENNNEEQSVEDILISEIEKIKIGNNAVNKDENLEEKNKYITTSDINNIKQILIKEYGVDEKCLKIN